MKKRAKITILLVLFCVSAAIAIIVTFFDTSRIIHCQLNNSGTIHIEEISVTNEEITDYIDSIKKNSAHLETVDKEIVEETDVVVISYSRYTKDGMLVEYMEDLDVLVGSLGFNEYIERELINKAIGEEYVLYDEIGYYNIYIHEIKKFVYPDLSETFLYDNYGVKTMDELYIHIEKKLYEQKRILQKKEKQEVMMREMIDNSLFYIKESEIKKMYQNYLLEQKNIAELQGYSFDEYICSVEKISIEEFADKCYKACVDAKKRELIVDKIWNEIDDTTKFKYVDAHMESFSNEQKEYIVMEYLFDSTNTN